jgi:hypothetical protein
MCQEIDNGVTEYYRNAIFFTSKKQAKGGNDEKRSGNAGNTRDVSVDGVSRVRAG